VSKTKNTKIVKGEKRMIEVIKKILGKVSLQREYNQTIVANGNLWRCTKCKMVFLNRVAGEMHDCSERLYNLNHDS
jgi:hypothetical protein